MVKWSLVVVVLDAFHLQFLSEVLLRAPTEPAQVRLGRPFHQLYWIDTDPAPGTRHLASANTLLLGQHRSLIVRNVDMFTSEVRPFPRLGTLGGLEQCPNVISGARRTPAVTRSQLDMFQPWRPDDSSWGVTLKATGYSNTYRHRKSRQISRSNRMIRSRGSARDNEGLLVLMVNTY